MLKSDRVFFEICRVFALIVLLVVAMMAVMLFVKSWPIFQSSLGHFFYQTAWDPVSGEYGALSFIYGTFVSSLLALLLALPLGLGIALFLTELAHPWLRTIFGFMVELLAAIPSVVYGLWGIFILVPFLRETVEPWLQNYFGFLPFFSGAPYGIGMLAAGLILTVMILPIICSISRDVFLAVPLTQREAAYALGATKWEAIRMSVLSYAKSGLIGASFLGLGRALGETMAVTMLIGNRPEISLSLFAPAHTMASVIANEFTEASDESHLTALFAIGATLFLLTFMVNSFARLLVRKNAKMLRGASS